MIYQLQWTFRQLRAKYGFNNSDRAMRAGYCKCVNCQLWSSDMLTHQIYGHDNQYLGHHCDSDKCAQVAQALVDNGARDEGPEAIRLVATKPYVIEMEKHYFEFRVDKFGGYFAILDADGVHIDSVGEQAELVESYPTALPWNSSLEASQRYILTCSQVGHKEASICDCDSWL